ncbi:MAG TPA: hypothetical protein VFZ34_24160 [Blastocatellia bacterium]|nr:hypothetical protein [Blastocatellia bacterium]
MPFQPFPAGNINGSITPSIITDPGQPPTDIIEAGVPFTVRVNWSVNGPAVPMMAGNWNVAVRFESIGPGPELLLNAPSVAFTAGAFVPPFTRNYNNLGVVNVPAGALTAGAYSMVVLLTYTTPTGQPGPLAGVSDEKIVQIIPNSPLTVP